MQAVIGNSKKGAMSNGVRQRLNCTTALHYMYDKVHNPFGAELKVTSARAPKYESGSYCFSNITKDK